MLLNGTITYGDAFIWDLTVTVIWLNSRGPSHADDWQITHILFLSNDKAG